MLATLLACVIFLPLKAAGQELDTSTNNISVKGFSVSDLQESAISYYIDSSGKSELDRIRQTAFSLPYISFVSQLYKSPSSQALWLKFDLASQTDSALKIYLYCGNINYIDLYFVSGTHPVRHIEGGNLHRYSPDSPFLLQLTQTLRLSLLPFQKGTVYLKLVQKTENYNYDGIFLYGEPALYQTIGEDSMLQHGFYNFQLVFQGILICQLLYVLFQWIIIRRGEYGYYFFYLMFISLYFLSRYEVGFQMRILFARFPLLRVYLNKTLLMLPYFFYFRFIRSFLDMPASYPVMNRWIIRIEYFILAYLVFDLAFVVDTFNVKLERELFTYILTLLFVTCACFITYLLREKKALIYFIISGSLFVGLGNIIGLILDYLEDEKILHHFTDKLIYSQVGIILEIFCFTAGLSFKSMSAEKEKIKSQENLIEQLKANELLQTKMQHIRNTIAQDLHDDIGSTLSSISILSNLALKEKNADQTLSTMHEIKDSSVILMEKMDDIVWSINPRNDSLENLLSRIRRFATTLFEAKNIDYTITIPETIHELNIPIEWRQHIYLILKEAINNLVKYSEATKACIEVDYHQGWLELLLSDNGRGFDSSRSFAGNGLLSMRHRAKEMQADLVIRSTEGQGCQLKLRLKIK